MKHYVAPRVEIVKLNSADLICTSLGYGGDGDGRPSQSRNRIYDPDDEGWDEFELN